MKNKGQIAITVITVIGSIISALIVGGAKGSEKADQKVEVLRGDFTTTISEVKERTTYLEAYRESMEKRMDGMDKKLDALLINQGINPSKLK